MSRVGPRQRAGVEIESGELAGGERLVGEFASDRCFETFVDLFERLALATVVAVQADTQRGDERGSGAVADRIEHGQIEQGVVQRVVEAVSAALVGRLQQSGNRDSVRLEDQW